MSITLDQLRKSRSVDFTKITTALTKSTESGFKNDDEDYFKLTKDKAGNASAVIRFLPAAEGDELPWVQIYSHAFQGPGGRWYIENCLSTIGKEDPVNDANRVLWQGTDKDKEEARKRKRKLKYTANVYVVSDPGNRQNEGKVMKFSFGKKIYEKIAEKLEPTFEDEKPWNIFDLWEGGNFKLRMRQVENYPNYDQSAFAEASAIAETDEEILEIVKQQKPLKELVDPSKFKSYADLQKKLEAVLSGTAGPKTAADSVNDAPSKPAPAPAKAKEAKVPKVSAPADDGDEGDMEEYFKSIAV